MSNLDNVLNKFSGELRIVKVAVRISFYLTSNLASSGFDNISLALQNQGFDVVSVDAVSRSYFPTEPVDDLITLRVDSQYSDADVIASIKQTLSSLGTVINAQIVEGLSQGQTVVNSTSASNVTPTDWTKAAVFGGMSLGTVLAIGLGIVFLPQILARK